MNKSIAIVGAGIVLLGAILFGLYGCGNGNGNVWADPVMIFKNSSSIRLAWNEVTTDIEGNPTYINFYEVYYRAHGAETWTYIGQAPDIEDPWFEINHGEMGDGYWDFGVIAIDMEGQASTIHSSLDNNAIPQGGFYVLWKISGGPPPKQSSGLRIIE